MFRKKRVKKDYPAGTFIPAQARVIAILQLCIAFTMVLWYASQPFVGEIFNIKSRLLLYQDVMGINPSSDISLKAAEKLERNAHRFQALSPEEKSELKVQMSKIQNELKKSFWEKLNELFSIFAYKLSRYEVLWLLFSIIIPVMLLKKVEGASHAVWILPLLVILYAVDNTQYKGPKLDVEAKLFPTENELIVEYGDGPLKPQILEQQKQLLLAWKHYLTVKWTGKTPSSDLAILEAEAEEGEHAFNLARLRLRAQNEMNSKNNYQKPDGLILISLYFLWNALFALIAAIYCKENLNLKVAV